MRRKSLVNVYPYNLYEKVFELEYDKDIDTAEKLISYADKDERFQKLPILLNRLSLKQEKTADIVVRRMRDHKTFNEISKIYGLSPSRITELFNKGCRMLRRYYRDMKEFEHNNIADESPIDSLRLKELIIYKLSEYNIKTIKDLLEWIESSGKISILKFQKDEIIDIFLALEKANLLNDSLNDCWKRSIEQPTKDIAINMLLDRSKLSKILLFHYNIDTTNQLVKYIEEHGFYFIDFTVDDCFYIFHKLNLYGFCNQVITDKFLEVCKLASPELKDKSKKKMEENKNE